MGNATQEIYGHVRSQQAEVKAATGEWIAGLADWDQFVTLTHRLPGDARPIPASRAVINTPTWTRVGIPRHRKLVRRYFYEVIRPRDPGARWWSEMELHESGVPHEHALLSLSTANVALLSIRQWWYEQCGYAKIDAITGDGRSPAEYVAKYTGKEGAYPPLILGFGLNERPSSSMTFDARARS